LVGKDGLIKELKKIKKENKLDYFLFAIVDIVNQVAHFIITSGEDDALLDHVFCGEMKDDVMSIEGLLSRKKQIVPPLEEHFANHDHNHCHNQLGLDFLRQKVYTLGCKKEQDEHY